MEEKKETTEQWIARMKMEYLQQRAEEHEFEMALGNDHSLENIMRVCEARLYSKKEKND